MCFQYVVLICIKLKYHFNFNIYIDIISIIILHTSRILIYHLFIIDIMIYLVTIHLNDINLNGLLCIIFTMLSNHGKEKRLFDLIQKAV